MVMLSIAFAALILTGVFVTIPFANAYWDNFEQFGPKVDRILFKLYATESAEYSAFEAGETDMTDWPLTKYWIDRWSVSPYKEKIGIRTYGGEIGHTKLT